MIAACLSTLLSLTWLIGVSGQPPFLTFISFIRPANNRTGDLLNKERAAVLSGPPSFNPAAARVFSFLRSTPYIKAVGINALNQLQVIDDLGKLYQLSGEALLNRIKSENRGSDKIFPQCTSTRGYVSDTPLPFPNLFSCCPLPTNIQCNSDPKYRTVDGSCNCLSDKNMGRSNRAFARWLTPDYADGLTSPRVARDNTALPSTRLVSSTILEKMPSDVHGILTQLHMSVGQFIDHDFDRTPISKLDGGGETLANVLCGASGCEENTDIYKECFPIPVAENDPFFNKECLLFVRSQGFFADDCVISQRQQANALTGWMDASQLYGSNKADLDQLRDFSAGRGKMKTSNNPVNPGCGPLLPTQDDEECRNVNNVIKCFLAGDARQNEQIGLTAMHTVFVRLHNVFEENLHNVNPLWDGERLFQETRKLVIAVWQNMVYREYLPPLLGDAMMKSKSLRILKKKKCFKGYSCKNFRGDVRNVFAAAAFRHGHSQVATTLRYSNPSFTEAQNIPFSTVMFDPNTIYQKFFSDDTCGVEAILFGITDHFSSNIDNLFTKQLTRHMFTDNPPSGVGTDLTAANMQRGRDHGIPGYTKWREFCDLSVPTTFSEMKDIPKSVRDELENLYKHVDDVDLYVAAIAEKPVRGGAIGPTFACLIGLHFQHVKFADRFWFERCNKAETFTKNQLANIRQYTFGRFYCDTLDKVQTIQKFPMMLSRKDSASRLGISVGKLKKRYSLYRMSDNERVPCGQHQGIKFNLWKE